ncbi:mating type protein MAT1-1-1 [Geosmithia morbida]|uniref:Mating type protein MAT1-1-1 n=1 Tax=Geosmithia morbida TaxID=1094350 RepID=A0A9P4YQC5_9HYPO|nr:mating type protein MAT1-1-1 [Geosmithia morbida]KAF4119844.1 mating type protein MAT1-1-1 [Geosmithia morbida]
MATRSNLIERLSTASAADLLELLDDEPLFSLAARYFQRFPETNSGTFQSASQAKESIAEPPKDKTKRPLNGFMAFRSYYMKIFPDVPQKSVSGFLTTLWNQDPFRNKWVLVAKVYSFIRDEVGKDKIPLSQFLGISCPLMKIISPSAYLSTLGWRVDNQNEKGQHLVRFDPAASNNVADIQLQNCPNTELDLLALVLDFGFLPAESFGLMQRMGANSNPIMTADTGNTTQHVVPCTIEKLDFLYTVHKNPSKAAKDLLGEHYVDCIMQDSGYRVYDVQDLKQIDHISMVPPNEPSFYQYGTTHAHFNMNKEPIFEISNIPDHRCYDISNSYDMDSIAGFVEPLGKYTYGFSDDSPPFSAHNDFQLMF